MNANAVPVLGVFEKKMLLEVPLFQRQYVWNEVDQWQPLWDDISLKFSQSLSGRKDAPIHFLGAMVLDQKQVPVTHVERRQIIDGQQRLTTLQIFLAALRDYCRGLEFSDLAKECSTFTANTGMMANKEVERFKVWPTQADRSQFADVMELGSPENVKDKYPLVRLKYQRQASPRPRMVEAYLFFFEQIKAFFADTDGWESTSGIPLSDRVEECLSALKNTLRVVVIDLDKEDDAQVIFETLNARGERLLPADLLRNFIFLRVSREDKPADLLYENYWAPFDNLFWREEVRQGRLSRPRSDLFMQHFLTSRRAQEIPIKNLYVEYRDWILRTKPFESVEQELGLLAKQRDSYRVLLEPTAGTAVEELATFLQAFDMSTLYPLLLRLAEISLSSADWDQINLIFQSYVLRRAICGLTNKNYNSVFLTLTRMFRDEPFTCEKLRSHLLSLRGDSTVWPTDEELRNGWMNQNTYANLGGNRLVYVLKRLSSAIVNTKSEDVAIRSPLTIEHIMPQQWQAHWPLQNGLRGLTFEELVDADADSELAIQTRKRDVLVQTIGNLTLLSAPLNASISNAAWGNKKPEILQHSYLPINQALQRLDRWDEDEILTRGKNFFEVALRLWPRPSN